jgi:hypothetical protein
VKPFAVVGATLNIALPLFSGAEPTVTPPTVNLTVPAGVPLVVVTVAVKLCVAEELPRAMEEGLAATDVVVFSATTSVAAVLVEPDSLPSPPYTAVIESKPTVNPFAVVAAKVNDAVPLESVPGPSVVVPFMNITVPVDAAGITVAVSVTEAPSVTEFGTDNIVVVPFLLTVGLMVSWRSTVTIWLPELPATASG